MQLCMHQSDQSIARANSRSINRSIGSTGRVALHGDARALRLDVGWQAVRLVGDVGERHSEDGESGHELRCGWRRVRECALVSGVDEVDDVARVASRSRRTSQKTDPRRRVAAGAVALRGRAAALAA